MNVFASDPCPERSAMALDDSRLRKMLTETVQLLCASLREHVLGDKECDALELYKRPPSGQELWRDWMACPLARGWVAEHGLFLNMECVRRFGHAPRSAMVLAPATQRTETGLARPAAFVNRARNASHGMDFRHVTDPHEAYRQYLTARWALEAGPRGARWSAPSAPPAWSLS